jgi:hypothetical protein
MSRRKAISSEADDEQDSYEWIGSFLKEDKLYRYYNELLVVTEEYGEHRFTVGETVYLYSAGF